MTPRVLLFGASLHTLRRTHRLGIEPLLLHRPTDRDEGHSALTGGYAVVDYDDEDAVLAGAESLRPFAQAVSVTEVGMLPAAQVNEHLGLGGTPAASVRALKDKSEMRRILSKTGLSPVQAALARSPTDITNFATAYGYPVIVKPVDATGSLAVSKLTSPAQIPEVWAAARRLNLPHMLVEEYLPGPEISAESFTFAPGNHHVIALTAKTTLPNFVEVAHAIPADLSPSAAVEIQALVAALLTAVDHRQGPAHTELKLTPTGPRIIESHNRQAGDHITDLVDLVYGIDLISQALAQAARPTAPWPTPPTATGAAAIRFLTPRPGPCTAITGLDDARAHPGVVDVEVTASPGTPIPEVRRSRDRSGHVMAQAPDPTTALTRATAAATKIHFHRT